MLVGFWKKDSGKPTLTWPESVDEALCFGWIDGVRRSVDAARYTIRFTPRRPGSTWSLVNVRKMEALLAAGRVHEAGRRAYAARTAEKTGLYSFERPLAELPPDALALLRGNGTAAAFWDAQPPGYRRLATHWVTSAKRPETRDRRLRELVACCARAERLPQFRR